MRRPFYAEYASAFDLLIDRPGRRECAVLDPENRQLLISERHELIKDGAERISDYHFVMRCWGEGRTQPNPAFAAAGRSV
jgi:hypothetical protein